MNSKKIPSKKYYYSISDKITTSLLLIAFLCCRPMLFGNNYSNIGMYLFVILVFVITIRKRGRVIVKRNAKGRVYICSMILFIYCLLQCILTRSDRMIAGIQTIILLLVSVTTFYLFLENKNIQTLFCRMLYAAMIIFAISYIISTMIMIIVGWDNILIATYDYGYYRNTDIYFPFTTTYGSMPFMGIIFRRLLGFCRESGLMQIFYVWGFFSADRYFEKYKIVQVFMVVGLLACFSSAGFIVFAISLFLYFDVRDMLKKKGLIKALIFLILFLFTVYIVFFAQGTSLSSRADATINDRMIGIYYGLSVFMEHPFFGGGFYSTLGNPDIQSGVCAIASLGQIGATGFILWLMTFFFSFAGCTSKKRYIYTNAALFITALFSQPIMFAPAMYIFNFLDCDNSSIMLEKANKIGDKNENFSSNAH